MAQWEEMSTRYKIMFGKYLDGKPFIFDCNYELGLYPSAERWADYWNVEQLTRKRNSSADAENIMDMIIDILVADGKLPDNTKHHNPKAHGAYYQGL